MFRLGVSASQLFIYLFVLMLFIRFFFVCGPTWCVCVCVFVCLFVSQALPALPLLLQRLALSRVKTHEKKYSCALLILDGTCVSVLAPVCGCVVRKTVDKTYRVTRGNLLDSMCMVSSSQSPWQSSRILPVFSFFQLVISGNVALPLFV